MQLTILGSGCSIIKLSRHASSFLLEVNNKKLLFDCGWGSDLQIIKAGHEIRDIDHIFISHPHGDHLGNLIPLMQSILVEGLYFPEKKRTKPLYLHGYKRFRDDYEKLRSIMLPERIEPYDIEIFEYSFNSREQDELIMQAREVKHCRDRFHAVGYRIQYKDKVFVYSGDTAYTDELVKLAFSADLAIFEMGVTAEEYEKTGPSPVHLSPQEAGQIAAKAEVKKLILSHHTDTGSFPRAEEEIRKNFQGEIYFATDLMKIAA